MGNLEIGHFWLIRMTYIDDPLLQQGISNIFYVNIIKMLALQCFGVMVLDIRQIIGSEGRIQIRAELITRNILLLKV